MGVSRIGLLDEPKHFTNFLQGKVGYFIEIYLLGGEIILIIRKFKSHNCSIQDWVMVENYFLSY